MALVMKNICTTSLCIFLIWLIKVNASDLMFSDLKAKSGCTTDSDWTSRYHWDLDENECKRGKVFPLTTLDYIGIPWLSILMSLATAAGLGGGEIVVPCIKIFFQFTQVDSSPLAQWCIMIAGITRFIINYKKKHPYRNAVAIDYSAAMILMPTIFLGSSIGVMMHSILPDIIQDFLLIWVLVYCVVESTKKGREFWKQESKERNESSNLTESKQDLQEAYTGPRQPSSFPVSDEQETDLYCSDKGKEQMINTASDGKYPSEFITSDRDIDKIESLQKKDRTHWQFDKLLPIWTVLIALVLQTIFRSGTVGNVKKCSPVYWVIYALYVLIWFGVVMYSINKLKRDINLRKRINFPSYRGEVKFDPKRIMIVCSVSILAGTIAAIVGIGGGMIYIPLLLIIGYPPFVASSTSMFMVMYSSIGNVIAYSVQGKVYYAYGAWYALWTMLGVILGVTGANKIVKKTGRQSLFIFLLAGVLVLGIIFSIVFNTLNIIDDVNEGEKIFKFKSVCN